jgi:splicing factor 4
MPAASTPTAKGKRKSRWGDPLTSDDHLVVSVISSFESPSKTTIADNIRKVKEQILEQQELNKAVLQIQKATQAHTAIQLEHNSLTKTEKEHLLRLKEMESTAVKAQELTEAAEGKHFVGDFLPADELTKFIEKTNSAKTQTVLSDYSDHKLTQSNIGYQLLQKAGWREGEGIGRNEDGILNPLNKYCIN